MCSGAHSITLRVRLGFLNIVCVVVFNLKKGNAADRFGHQHVNTTQVNLSDRICIRWRDIGCVNIFYLLIVQFFLSINCQLVYIILLDRYISYPCVIQMSFSTIRLGISTIKIVQNNSTKVELFIIDKFGFKNVVQMDFQNEVKSKSLSGFGQMSQNEHLQGESMCWNKYCMSCYMMTKHRPLLVRHIDSISCWYN